MNQQSKPYGCTTSAKQSEIHNSMKACSADMGVGFCGNQRLPVHQQDYPSIGAGRNIRERGAGWSSPATTTRPEGY